MLQKEVKAKYLLKSEVNLQIKIVANPLKMPKNKPAANIVIGYSHPKDEISMSKALAIQLSPSPKCPTPNQYPIANDFVRVFTLVKR